MTRIIAIIIIFAFTILFHSSVESASQNIGLSFTLSKMMPYVFQAVFLLILFIECYRTIFVRFSNILRRVLGMLILIVGGGIAFAIHPIYEGDFKHEYKPVFFTGNSSNQLKDGLTMVALPGCPYCYERLEDLNRFVELYPTQEVYIQVVNNDSLALEEYQERADNAITVTLAPDQNALKSLIGDRYPSFIYIKPDTKEGMLWNNNGFGVAAMDFVMEND